MRDGAESRRRLLDAATAEFAAVGIAGARVDRIAAAAEVNKAQMYDWFGSKDKLFDAVFAGSLDRIIDVVPFTPKDLSGYAVALYDSYLSEPEPVRLASWYRLEREPSGDLLANYPGHWEDKIEAIAVAQAEGYIVTDIAAKDIYPIVIALAGPWSPISPTFSASPTDPAADHQRRRKALRTVVARALVAGVASPLP